MLLFTVLCVQGECHVEYGWDSSVYHLHEYSYIYPSSLDGERLVCHPST